MWLGLFRWSAQLLSWGGTLLVLRILTPADYGILGMTTYFVGLTSVLSEFGIGSALLATRDLPASTVKQLNLLAILLGFTGLLLAALAAPLASRWFGEPALRAVFPVLGAAFLIDSLRTVPVALMAKELDYRRTATADFVRALASSLAVVTLALLGLHYWALVAGIITGSLAATTWVLFRRRIGWALPSYAELRTPIRYCRHLVVERLAWQGYQNADFLVAGRMFGRVALGNYGVAWTLVSLPGEKLLTVINAGTAPFFAALKDRREELRYYFLRVTEVLALLLFPILIGLLLVVDLAIPVILGTKWVAAIAPARALLPYALLHVFLTTLLTVLVAIGRTDISMRNGLLSLLVLPLGFVVGGRLYGLTGIALVWTLTYPLVLVMPLRVALRSLKIRFGEYCAAFLPALWPTALMVVLVLGVRWLTGPRLSPPAELILAILVGGLGYGAVLLLWQRERLRSLLGLLKRSAQRTAADASEGASSAPAQALNAIAAAPTTARTAPSE
jgi:O-antigen/teichoic acid export membrane protein